MLFYIRNMKKSVFILFVIFLSLFFHPGCRPYPEIDDQLLRVERQIRSYPDSALPLLERIDPRTLCGNSSKARYALLYSHALDGNGIDLKTDSVLAPALHYYLRHGSPEERAYTNYYAGCISANAGETDEAVRRFIAAETDAAVSSDSELLGRIYSCLGNLYYSQYCFDEAMLLYGKAEHWFKTKGRGADVGSIETAKARTWLLKGDYAESREAFRRAIDLFEKSDSPEQLCLLTRDLANVMIDCGEVPVDSVKRFLRQTYSRYTSGITPKADYPLWARLHLQENRIDSARYYGQRISAASLESRDKLCGLYSLMSRIEEKSGRYREAVFYWKRYAALFDSIVRDEKRNLVQRAEKKYRNRELRAHNEVLRLHNRLVYCIGGSLLFVILSVFLLILHHRRRLIGLKSEQIANYRHFIGVLNEEYADLKERYELISSEMDSNSKEEIRLIRTLENRLSALQKLLDMSYAGCKPATFFAAFKQYAASMGNREAAFSDLQFVVNKRFNGIVDRLREKHPALTNSELDMLCMLLFGFSFDCIRLIYNHDNVDSLYSRRTKIREKLQLAPRYRLERYLSELAADLHPDGQTKRHL